MKQVNINENFLELKNHKTREIFYFSSEKGLYEFLKWRQEKEKSGEPEKEDKKELILSVANYWIGKDFNPGQKEQCCYFVRAVFEEAGIDLGVTKKPSDNYLPTGEGYANSLSGDDIGEKIVKEKDLLPGDLVFFKNTYGDYSGGVITHVGIYIGNGFMVHRSTSSKPVQKVLLSEYYSGAKFKEGRRIL